MILDETIEVNQTVAILKEIRDNSIIKKHIITNDDYQVLIGRDVKVNKLVINDNKVSRKHCKLIFDKNKTYIEDDNSKNGTFVVIDKKKNRVDSNGWELYDGNIILIGETVLILQIL